MSSKYLLAVVALALWGAAGCASILGVDSSDYGDAAGILCTCADNPDSCAAEVEKRVADDPELEQTALDCMEEDQDCKKVASCVYDAGYCAGAGKRCIPNAELDALSRCCEGLACENAKCCGADGVACTGAGECCSGTCDEGVCRTCVPRGGLCAAGDTCCVGSCDDSGTCRVLDG